MDEFAQFPAISTGELQGTLEVWPSGHAEDYATYIDEVAPTAEEVGVAGIGEGRRPVHGRLVGIAGLNIQGYTLEITDETTTRTYPIGNFTFSDEDNGYGFYVLGDPVVAINPDQDLEQLGTFNLVTVATEAGSFSTLLKAVEAAGLVEVLQGEGPFTVFAPTDEAFAKLPAGALDALLADREALAAVLTYHVLPAKVTAANVVEMGRATPETVQGETLDIVVRDGTVHVDEATVITADVMATNGVIHVIDTVLMP